MPRTKNRPPLIEIYGGASKKLLKSVRLTKEDQAKNLMLYVKSLGFPLASSCEGDGICHLCIVNENLISCQMTVGELKTENNMKKITISYL
jgi:ferredoxin